PAGPRRDLITARSASRPARAPPRGLITARSPDALHDPDRLTPGFQGQIGREHGLALALALGLGLGRLVTGPRAGGPARGPGRCRRSWWRRAGSRPGSGRTARPGRRPGRTARTPRPAPGCRPALPSAPARTRPGR